MCFPDIMEDTTTNYSTIIISVLMAVVIIATVMMPIITATTQTVTTTEIDNEGGGWLKLGYNEGADYSFNVGYETITVDEVETEIFKVGEQTGDYENMICYADPQRTLFISGDNWYLLTNGESPSVYKFTDTASVSNISGTLIINDGSTVIYSGTSPTWAYVPDANGIYGFFTEGGLTLEEDKPTVAVGSYAGVFAYNNTVVAPNGYGNLGLTMSGNYAEGETTWIVGGEPSAPSLPVANENDWTFNYGSYSRASAKAYTGSNPDYIVIPNNTTSNDTLYNVSTLGNGSNSVFANTVFDSDGASLVIGDNITYFAERCCYNTTSLNGTLVIPNNGTVTFGGSCFYGCTGITGLIFLNGGNFVFNDSRALAMDNCNEVLNLSTAQITTTTQGLTADSVQDHVTALGYIAPTSIHETVIVEDTSLSATLLKLLPVFMVLTVVIFIGYAMYRPDSDFIKSLKSR